MTSTIGTEVEKRDNSPRGLIEQYSTDFATVLPSHIKPETWVRVAQGALKKGRIYDGDRSGRFELEVAAANNPAAFLSALLDAARQGLEPGTEQYYLTPRKVGNKLEILGMRGYQGEIELIYRAGAVSSVVVEAVRTNDKFSYKPGQGTPDHEIDWDSDDRGELRLVYAYGVMKDGAISKVVVLNKKDIERIKGFAQGTGTKYSPWNTSEEAMWLKSAAHQLRKWVPTSAEFAREQARNAGTAAAAAVAEARRQAIEPLRAERDFGANPNMNGDQIFEAEIVPTSDEPAGVDTRTGLITDAAAARAAGEDFGTPQDDDPRDQSFFEDLEAGR
jgi:recombination protein RecT